MAPPTPRPVADYDEIAETDTTNQLLPLVAERVARQRLQALTRNQGHVTDGKPVVLFLCVHNAGRSQRAVGFLTQYAPDLAIAWLGGSAPGGAVGEVASVRWSARRTSLAARRDALNDDCRQLEADGV